MCMLFLLCVCVCVLLVCVVCWCVLCVGVCFVCSCVFVYCVSLFARVCLLVIPEMYIKVFKSPMYTYHEGTSWQEYRLLSQCSVV